MDSSPAESHDARIARAKAYPFRIPRRSYLFVNGDDHELAYHGACPLSEGVLGGRDGPVSVADHLAARGVDPGPGLDGRVPVIASGSNQSPEQLRRKFGGVAGDVVIPVSRCRLADFDAVYSAHVSRNGSIAATLQHSPGCTVALMVTWLTPAQLGHMHPTEARGENYDYVRLDGVALVLDGGVLLDRAYAYASRHGCLAVDGRPVALAAVRAEGRAFPALGQEAVLARARDRLAPGSEMDGFILENVADAALRRARTAALSADALPFAWPDYQVIVD